MEDLERDILEVSIIGHRQRKGEEILEFLIQIEYSSEAWRCGRTFEEFNTLYVTLLHIFQLLPQFPYILPSSIPQLSSNALDNLQHSLNHFLNELLTRIDVLGMDVVHQFLELHLGHNVKFKIYPLPNLSTQIEAPFRDYKITDFAYVKGEELLILGHEDSSGLSNIGVVWNLIEREKEGAITLWSRNKIPLDMLSPEGEDPSSAYKLTLRTNFIDKISKILFIPATWDLIIGLDTGSIIIGRITHHNIQQGVVKDKGTNGDIAHMEATYSYVKGKEHKLFMNRVLGLEILKKDIIVGVSADNHLKIFDCNEEKPIAGGSLNKRLEGAYLNTMLLDAAKYLVYLGTTTNTLFIYSLHPQNFQPNHLYTLSLPCKGFPINRLRISWGNLFVGNKDQVTIFSLASNREPEITAVFELSKYTKNEELGSALSMEELVVVDMAYSEGKQQLFVGTLQGAMFVFNTKTAELLTAFWVDEPQMGPFAHIPDTDVIIVTSANSSVKILEMKDVIEKEIEHLDPPKVFSPAQFAVHTSPKEAPLYASDSSPPNPEAEPILEFEVLDA